VLRIWNVYPGSRIQVFLVFFHPGINLLMVLQEHFPVAKKSRPPPNGSSPGGPVIDAEVRVTPPSSPSASASVPVPVSSQVKILI